MRVNADWWDHLKLALHYVKQSGQSYGELRELLDTRFAKDELGGGTAPSLVAVPGTDGCSLVEQTVSGLDTPEAEAWDVAHRFLRLRGALGWKIAELDKVKSALGAGLDDAFLVQLADIVSLRERVGRISLAEMASWWGDLDRQATPSREEPSLYDVAFLTPSVVYPVPEVFADLEAGTLIEQYAQHIAGAARLSAADLELLTSYDESAARLRLPNAGPAAAGDDISLATLSRLYRLSSLARALRLRVSELVVLTALSGLTPLAGDDAAVTSEPAHTLAFARTVERLDALGLRAAELSYWLRHVVEPGGGVGAQAQLTAARLAALEAALASVESDTAMPDEIGAEALHALLVEQLTTDNAAREPSEQRTAGELAFRAATVVDIVTGVTVLEVAEQRAALLDILGDYVADVTALQDRLAFRPYDATHGLASCQLWLEPGGIQVTGTAVTAWASTGPSVTVEQTTAGLQPVFAGKGPFGLPAIDCSGGRYLDVALSYAETSHTLVSVVSQRSRGAGEMAVLDASDLPSGERLSFFAETDVAGKVGFESYDGDSGGTVSGGDGRLNEQMLTWVLDDAGGLADIYRDGARLGDSLGYADPAQLTATTAALGGKANGFDGLISVVGLFNAALAAAELAAVHDYLRLRMGQPPAWRFALVFEPLQQRRRERLGRATAIETVAAQLGVPAGVATTLLTEVLDSFSQPGVAKLIADFAPASLIDPSEVPSRGERLDALVRAGKAAAIVGRLGMDDELLRWIAGPDRNPAWLDLNDLPVRAAGTAAFDSSLVSAAGGQLRLPPWLELTCATAGRSVQIGAAEVRSGLPAHAARAYSGDGQLIGLLLEPAATNLIDNQDLRTWTLSGTPAEIAVHHVQSPDGTEQPAALEDLDASGQSSATQAFDGYGTGWHTLSSWTWLDGPALPGGSEGRLTTGAGSLAIDIAALDPAWIHRSASEDFAMAPSSPTAAVVARTDVDAALGTLRVWGTQVEARRYPTSFIGAGGSFTRAADTLRIDAGTFSPVAGGFFSVTLTYAPLYAHDETSGEHNLVYFDDDNRLFYDGTKLVLRIDGASVDGNTLTFSRHQTLTVTAAHRREGLELTVSGATTGNGVTTGDGQDAVTLPAHVYLFGKSSGTEEAAVLYRLDWLSHTVGEDVPAAQARFAALLELAAFTALQPAFRVSELSLPQLLARGAGAEPVTEGEFLTLLAASTGWSVADVVRLASTTYGLTYPGDYLQGDGLVRLHRAIPRLRAIGLSVTEARALLDVDESATNGRATVAAIRQLVNAKYSVERFREIAKPIRDELREAQRDALVAFIRVENDWPTDADFFENLLVDVKMSACQLTSRLKLAISSVQSFIQRMLMGLETEYVAGDPLTAREYDWMKNYRVWEANRKIFLWPENWLEPEWRDDKTPLFEAFESELKQGELTDEAAERAYRTYLEGYHDLGNLAVVAMAEQVDEENGIDRWHLIGRTPAPPHRYYHRWWEDRREWTPWRPMELEIEGDHITAFVTNRRLSVAWASLEYVEPSQSSNDAWVNGQTKLNAVRMSTWSAGQWNPPVVAILNAPLMDWWKPPSSYALMPGKFGDLILVGEAMTPTGNGGLQALNLTTMKPPVSDHIGTRRARFWYDPCARRVAADFFESTVFRAGVLGGTRLFDSASAWWSHGWSADNIYVWRAQGAQGQSTSLVHVASPAGSFTITPGKASLRSSGIQAKALEMLGALLGLGPPQRVGADDVEDIVVATAPEPFDHFVVHQEGRTFFVRSARYLDARERYEPTSAMLSDLDRSLPTAFNVIVPDDPDVAAELVEWLRQLGYVPASYRTVFKFEALHHPFACDLIQAADAKGVRALSDWSGEDPVQDRRSEYFEEKVKPNVQLVDRRYPVDELDFRRGAAAAVYNWELFFHAPYLIATLLMREQRHEEARRWLHAIFDPTDPVDPDGGSASRFWKVKPLHDNKDLASIEDDLLGPSDAEEAAALLRLVLGKGDDALYGALDESKSALEQQIADWRKDPFKPYLVARHRWVAFQKATVRLYIDNLVQWGDQLFRRDTIESINEATQIYLLASQLLGERPTEVQSPAPDTPKTFEELDEEGLDAFSNVTLENVAIGSPRKKPGSKQWPPPPVVSLYFCVPPNDELLGLWDIVEDRLYKIRHCMNIEGVVRQLALFEPPIDPALLIEAAAAGLSLSSVLDDLAAPRPHHRFRALLPRAVDVVQTVIGFGSSLLAALEKREGETLGLVRQRQEIDMLDLVRAIRKDQIAEAAESRRALEESKQSAQLRRDYYASREFINASESAAEDARVEATRLSTVSQFTQAAASVMFLMPDIQAGIAAAAVFGGKALGAIVESQAKLLSLEASVMQEAAQRASTRAGHQRRWDDWKHQESLAEQELKQLDKQITAATIRERIAEGELRNTEKQRENAKEVEQFLKSKFTNDKLYAWQVEQLSTLYFQAYRLAYEVARAAESAYRFERAEPDASFIKFGYWDGRRNGLVAGEKLLLDLKRMEASYFKTDRRDYELRKPISLAEHFPGALLALRATGSAVVTLDERLFDGDYPGHYLRRIKSVSLTIPAVSGPLSRVNCTLTQLSSKIRSKPLLQDGEYVEDEEGQDSRFIYHYGAVSSVCTSSGQNDAGVFELSFQDERYLPFEGTGAVSQWRIELPPENNRFDLNEVTDIVIEMSYVAREGGGRLRGAAHAAVLDAQPHRAVRLLRVSQELRADWHAFQTALETVADDPDPVVKNQLLTFSLVGLSPFIPGTGEVRVSQLRAVALWAGEAPMLSVTITAPSTTETVVQVPPAPSLTGVLDASSAPEALDGWELRVLHATLDTLPGAVTESYAGAKRLRPDKLLDLFLIVDLEREVAV